MDKLRALQAFAKVAELASFTRAADQLQWPKASLTLLVQQLEQELSLKLLHRTTRKLSLTDDGAAYLATVQRLLADLADAEDTLTLGRSSPRGRLRVDVPASAGRHVIAPALPEFLARYPGIQIELGSSDRPVDLAVEGVDCVIRGGNVFDEQLVARKLGEFEVVTVAAPSYIAERGRIQHPRELAQHRTADFFSAKTGRVFPFDFEGRGQHAGESFSLRGQSAVACNDADTQVAATLAGLGLAQLPLTRVLAEHMAAGHLVRVLPEWQAGSLPLHVLYPRNRHLSAKVRAFVDWVVALYAQKFERLRGLGAPNNAKSAKRAAEER